MKSLFNSSQITPSFQKKCFRNFKYEDRPQIIQDAYHCALAYYQNFYEIKNTEQNSIALLGEPGSGKTHLLMSVANNLIKKGIPVLYFPWVEGFNELKDDFNLLNEKIKHLSGAPVLFIDDLFKGGDKPTTFELKQLYALINYRYLNNLPFLISCELTIDEINRIDKAIGSRIYERCKDYLVILKDDQEQLNYRLID